MATPNANTLLTRHLTLVSGSGLGIALLVGLASVAGILYPGELYPDASRPAFVITDVLNLVIGLPLLVGSLWLARRGKLIGLLAWQGALLYVLYIYFPYLIGIPFNALFLLYLLCIILCIYTLITILSSIDGEAVRQRLQDHIPARACGGVLVALALLILVRQVALIVAAIGNGTPVNAEEIAIWVDDLAIMCPLFFITGIQLWRRKVLGYVAGGGLFLALGALSLGVIPLLFARALADQVPPDIGGMVVLFVMAALCLVPFAFFVRGSRGENPPDLPLTVTGKTRS